MGYFKIVNSNFLGKISHKFQNHKTAKKQKKKKKQKKEKKRIQCFKTMFLKF
jgi:hypothetical protein